MAIETLTLRRATAADLAPLTELVAQHHHAEEPRVLRGPVAGRLRLFGFLLANELASGSTERFLAVNPDGIVLGSAGLRLGSDPPPGSLPRGLFPATVRAVGLADALRFYGYLLRGSLISESPLRRGECYLYSVVVREEFRRQGVGTAMMGLLEEQARRAGVRVALLRVLAANEPARQLYQRLGYRVVARSRPPLGPASELMRKELG